MSQLLYLMMNLIIKWIRLKKHFNINQVRWRPGEPLKLLLTGYTGARNTGADIRVEEIVRQVNSIFQGKDLSLYTTTINKQLTAGYFRGSEQIYLPTFFPFFLLRECPAFHGILACEGSMFKSKFSDALSIFLAGSLGIANMEDKLSIGYGGEAGFMNRQLAEFVRRCCEKSLVIARNDNSRTILRSLNIETSRGADTAWTFRPAPPAAGEKILREYGWDGKKKILGICPINPFCWPVKPSLVKLLCKGIFKRIGQQHYKSLFFHCFNKEDEQKYKKYISNIADAVNRYLEEHIVFPVIIGMERLDRGPCKDLAARLNSGAPLFVSDQYNMYQMVSVLRQCHMIISSRFHAIVTSMPGLVPSAGITMDERIYNLMADRGDPGLCIRVDADHLADGIFLMLKELGTRRDEIVTHITQNIPGHIQKMGEMGLTLVGQIKKIYPEFPVPDHGRSWEKYLPPISEDLVRILGA